MPIRRFSFQNAPCYVDYFCSNHHPLLKDTLVMQAAEYQTTAVAACMHMYMQSFSVDMYKHDKQLDTNARHVIKVIAKSTRADLVCVSHNDHICQFQAHAVMNTTAVLHQALFHTLAWPADMLMFTNTSQTSQKDCLLHTDKALE